MLHFPFILNAQYIDTKWTVTGYFGELWYAEEEDILGKQQEFFKGWADGVFYSCDYAGQSATYNSYTIKEFIENKEFELVNQDKAFSKVTSPSTEHLFVDFCLNLRTSNYGDRA